MGAKLELGMGTLIWVVGVPSHVLTLVPNTCPRTLVLLYGMEYCPISDLKIKPLKDNSTEFAVNLSFDNSFYF